MVGAVEIDREIALAIAGLLTGLDPAIHRVGEHNHLERHVAAHHGLQLAAGETKTAVAHGRNHQRIGLAHRRAERRRQRIAERAMRTVGDEVAALLWCVEIRREVRAGRARIGHRNRALGQ
ncbi:hypothetical protein SDC9_142064 [bioreactor metagenome]|uniref:Uncharacterized protein n=1 Tax=bioreactor metagenome TaxID=1076179 RepID=A0A645E034_9ZZZZ